MTAATAPAPGLYDGIEEEDYHRDPAFSQSQAKALLVSPAKYRWGLEHPAPPRAVFDFGHAAHAKVLGVGAPVVTVHAESWRTKAATEAAAEARAAGAVPLLARDVERVDAMAVALEADPLARSVFASAGRPEVSLWWSDPDTDVECRARVDFLAETPAGLVNVDYKSTSDASPRGFARSAGSYGYHLQAAAYEDGLLVLTGEAVPTVLVAQEKEPPYLVGVYRFAAYDIDSGYARWTRALAELVRCRAADHWPGYETEITELALPSWAA